ncbi:BnaCnng24780D [Brassica napus]|uniref:BnaCnng24780D protein n=1 Tax=Brassica napus TaxID=3708 RepID=A0A078IU00_BRANA|nr:BnaCnng24780D [Brassica napus]
MPSGRSDSAVKLITYSEELVDGKPFYEFSNSRPVKALNREPAGHAFHSAALKLLGCAEKPSAGEGSNKKVGDDDKEEEYSFPSFNPYANNKANKKKKKKPGAQQQQDHQQDHYALLGLRNLRYLATEDQIKKSYREAALKHHPDKQHAALLLAEETEEAKEAKKDEIDSRFRAIQEAYEVLMDPTKRKIFDSTDEFDDEDCSPQEFFKVFGPAFKRIAKLWAKTSQRVPDLGDENTKLKDVEKFYSFWYGFKSLREFPDRGKHDLEKADSRQERRWMERENAKKTAKDRKEDDVRIRNLVDNAYRIDPRIAKREEEEEAKKQRKKEAKVMAEKKREEEAAEKEKMRKEEAKESAEKLKKEKEKERKLLLKERNRLRTLSAHVLAQRLLSKEDVENLCMSLNIQQLQSLCDTMGNKQGVELANVIKDHEANSKEKENEKANSKEKECEKANADGDAEPTKLDNTRKKQPWSKEEIDKLRKGIIKYPKGISRRWEVISDYIGTGRTVEEVLKATKTVLLQKPDSAKAFDTFLEKRKPTVSIASPLSTREEELGESLPMANNGEASGSSDADDHEANSKEKENEKANSKEKESSGSSDADGWSSVQERALVQALKTLTKETSQRWERVAAAVPGKTMVQCKKKFAELKELIRSKKAGV